MEKIPLRVFGPKFSKRRSRSLKNSVKCKIFHQKWKIFTEECSNSYDFGEFSTNLVEKSLLPFGMEFGTREGQDAEKNFNKVVFFSTSAKCSNSCGLGIHFFLKCKNFQ